MKKIKVMTIFGTRSETIKMSPLINKTKYEKMSKASNPYRDGKSSKKIKEF